MNSVLFIINRKTYKSVNYYYSPKSYNYLINIVYFEKMVCYNSNCKRLVKDKEGNCNEPNSDDRR